MDTLSSRPPRTAQLVTLAALIIVADQLSKAWFVFVLSSNNNRGSFGEFLGHYFSLWSTGNDSIIFETYGPFFRNIYVWEPWIRFRLTTNTGAAWSMFDGNSFILSFVSLAIVVLLVWVWLRNFRYNPAMTVAIGAIIGGALGNAIDRFRLREVVDFIAVRIPWIGQLFPKMGDPYDFPIFNIADSAAVCGTLALAGYLLWLDLVVGKRKRRAEAANEPSRYFPGGIQLDDEAMENLHKLDTKSLPVWDPTDGEQLELQEEASEDVVDEQIVSDSTDDVPALTSDYVQTRSGHELSERENADAVEAGEAVRDGGAYSPPLEQLLPDPRSDGPLPDGADER